MKRNALLILMIMLVAAGCGKKQKNVETVSEPAAGEVDMSQYMPSLSVGAEAPDFEAPNILDEAVKLSDFRGNFVVVDFWATWCKDCRAEVPVMKQLYDKYAPKGVQFLGVSFDTDRESLISYCIENDIAWLQVCNGIKWKENPISIAFDLHWIPTMFLIGPDGKVAGVCFTADKLGKILAEAVK